MTPEREAYLAKCSKKEKFYRDWIAFVKQEIKVAKEALNSGFDNELLKLYLYNRKHCLMMYRHELARLKGMDRVVVPKRPILARWSGIWLGYCKCNGSVKSLEVYCPHCGRRILWEKVK